MKKPFYNTFLFLEKTTLKDAVRNQDITFNLSNVIIGGLYNIIFSNSAPHCDIKPDNILVSNEGPELIDYDRSSSIYSQLIKKPTMSVYTHPNLQKYCKEKLVDYYSLALVLYYMHTGQDPNPNNITKIDHVLYSKRIEYILQSLCCTDIDDVNEFACNDFLIYYFDVMDFNVYESSQLFTEYTKGSVFAALMLLLKNDLALDKQPIVQYIISQGYEDLLLATYDPLHNFDLSDVEWPMYQDKYNTEIVAWDEYHILPFALLNGDYDSAPYGSAICSIESYLDLNDIDIFFTFYYSIGVEDGRRLDYIQKAYDNSIQYKRLFRDFFDVNEINACMYYFSQRAIEMNCCHEALQMIYFSIYLFELSTHKGSMEVALEMLNELFFLTVQCKEPIENNAYICYYRDILSIQFAMTAIDFYDYIYYCFPKISVEYKDIGDYEFSLFFYTASIDYYHVKTTFLMDSTKCEKAHEQNRAILKAYTNSFTSLLNAVSLGYSDEALWNRICRVRESQSSLSYIIVKHPTVESKPMLRCVVRKAEKDSKLDKYENACVVLVFFRGKTDEIKKLDYWKIEFIN